MSGRRRSRRKQIDASHQRNWLTGRNAVSETLAADVWPVQRLCGTAEALQRLSADGTRLLDAEVVSSDRLTELCGSRHHQGLAAQMGEFPCSTPESLISLIGEHPSIGKTATPLIVICDRMQDAHNFGAILRCADAMSVSAVVIGDREQVGITPQVARSSAGAVNRVSIVRSDRLATTVQELKNAGVHLVAATEQATDAPWNIASHGTTALVIGSEARGISIDLLDLCDQQVAIPMHGQANSLNAAVAAGILLYELRRSAIPQSEP